MKIKTISALIVCALLLACPIVCAADNTKDNVPAANPVIIYCWGTDRTNGLSWVNFLVNRYYTATQFAAGNAPTTDFAGVDIIIIGYDTATNWSTSAQMKAIKNANKPILGIGGGGYNYFWYAGMGTDNHGMGVGNHVNMQVLDSNSDIYKKPGTITIPVNNTLTVNSAPTTGMGLFMTSLPVNVTSFTVDSTYTGHAMLTFEASKCMYWGYSTQKPYDLTPTGASLLVNAIHFCSNKYVPEFQLLVLIPMGMLTLVIVPIMYRQKKEIN